MGNVLKIVNIMKINLIMNVKDRASIFESENCLFLTIDSLESLEYEIPINRKLSSN